MSSIDINGKKLLPIKEAISIVDYSRDYLTRLAREKKIVATQIGRMWYVDIDSINNYQEVSLAEQEIKKRQLSDQRKNDLAIKEIKIRNQRVARKRAQKKTPAIIGMCLVVALGVGMGMVLESQTNSNFAGLAQLANVKTVALETENESVADVSDYVSSARQEIIPTFSPNVSHKDLTSQEGLLLLPVNASGTVEAQGYFSDPVTIIHDAEGNSAVMRLNADGVPVGGEIPFVIVPVNSSSP